MDNGMPVPTMPTRIQDPASGQNPGVLESSVLDGTEIFGGTGTESPHGS